MVEESLYGLMEVIIKESLKKTTLKGQGIINGLMVEPILENGKLTKWKALEHSPGLTEEGT